MGMADMLNDVKTHFEHGAELAASHIAPLLEFAARAEADPLVQVALGLAVGPETRVMLADFLKRAEAEFQRVAAESQAKAEAEAQAKADAAAAEPAAPDPEPAPEPAEDVPAA